MFVCVIHEEEILIVLIHNKKNIWLSTISTHLYGVGPQNQLLVFVILTIDNDEDDGVVDTFVSICVVTHGSPLRGLCRRRTGES